MATNRKIYEIRLEDISQNGTLCANPTVDFEKPYCADIRCYTEVSDGEIVLKVEIPEDCPDGCVYAIIDCADDCGECEPERVQICPCTEDADCPDCQVCENNLCVSTCPEGQFCSDGDCVDCDEDTPCPCNQVCVNGDCQCPPSRPYVDSRGCCSDCSPTALCPPCYVCTVDGCEPIVCPEGTCDPETGECVECLGSGDCDGDNECCVDKKCECCFGFVRDPETGGCVPDPGCITDADCPECEICTETGCEEQTCPDGYVFTGSYPCCLKECDCLTKDCPGTQNCIIFDDVTCVCVPCTGTCDDNGDCGEGCYCNQGVCVTNPCFAWCYDGTDCAEGCGCDDGRCVPCDSLSCSGTECAQASGCGCDGSDCIGDPDGCFGACLSSDDCGDGCGCFQGNCMPCEDIDCEDCVFALGCDCVDTTCEESTCKGTCAGFENCPGVDCGCYDGECVECQAFSCEVDPCPEGCVCDNGTCVGNPCRNVSCEENADCGESCYCDEGFCTPCPDDNQNCGTEDCGDLLIVGKNDEDCTLEATLTQDACCNCRNIVVSPLFELDPGAGDGIITINWRVGKIADVAHHSSLPEHTTVNDASGNPVDIDGSHVTIKRYVYKTDGTFSVFTLQATGGAGITELTLTEAEFPTLPGSGNVVRVEYVLTNATVEFADQCEYELTSPLTLLKYTLNESEGFEDVYEDPKPGADLTKITQCRSPLFAFRKGTTTAITSAASPFVWKYGVAVPPPSPTDQKIWVASADLADGLEYAKYYEVSVDCGCADPQFYSCYGPEQTATKLVFCHLDEDDLVYTVDATTNCEVFAFDENITIDCDVMAAGNPKYRLLVNGAVLNSVGEITAAAGSIPLVALGNINAGAEITSVGLRLVEDVCLVCDTNKDADCERFSVQAVITKDACDVIGTFTVTITTTADPLEQLQYTISDSGGAIDTGTFYNSNIVVTGLADPAGADPITVEVERISDGVIDTVVQIYDPTSGEAAANLLLDTGCSGTQAYVRGTNNYATSATLQVFAAGTATSLGSANVAPGGIGTVLFAEDTLVDITFSLNADPTCAVTQSDVVLNCCDEVDEEDFVVEHTCSDAETVEMSYTNNSGATMTFRLVDSSSTIIETKTVAAGSTVYSEVTVESGKTYYVYARSATSSGCPQTLLYTFAADDCCTDVLESVTISRECRSGNGRGSVATLIVNNGTVGPQAMQVYLVVGTSSTLLYSGSDRSFEYTPSSAPTSASVRVVVGDCSKTEAFFFNCEA